MANVPTASNSVDDSIPTSVEPEIIMGLRHLCVMPPLVSYSPFNRGEGAAKVFPRGPTTLLVANTITTGSAEADAVDAQEFITDGVTATATMKAIFVVLSAMAEYTSASDLVKYIGMELARAGQTAVDTALAALLASFSNTNGTTTLEITPEQFLSAVVAYNTLAKEGSARGVFVGHHKFYEALSKAAISGVGFGGNGFVQLPGVMDLFANTGAAGGYKGNYMGIPFILSGVCPTANVGADRVGAIFTRPSSPTALDGALVLRSGMPEYLSADGTPARIIGTIHQMRMPFAVAELNDDAGQTLLTDA